MTTGWHGAVPASPLLDRMWAPMSATWGRAGTELDMGSKLRQTLIVTAEAMGTPRTRSA